MSTGLRFTLEVDGLPPDDLASVVRVPDALFPKWCFPLPLQ